MNLTTQNLKSITPVFDLNATHIWVASSGQSLTLPVATVSDQQAFALDYFASRVAQHGANVAARLQMGWERVQNTLFLRQALPWALAATGVALMIHDPASGAGWAASAGVMVSQKRRLSEADIDKKLRSNKAQERIDGVNALAHFAKTQPDSAFEKLDVILPRETDLGVLRAAVRVLPDLYADVENVLSTLRGLCRTSPHLTVRADAIEALTLVEGASPIRQVQFLRSLLSEPQPESVVDATLKALENFCKREPFLILGELESLLDVDDTKSFKIRCEVTKILKKHARQYPEEVARLFNTRWCIQRWAPVKNMMIEGLLLIGEKRPDLVFDSLSQALLQAKELSDYSKVVPFFTKYFRKDVENVVNALKTAAIQNSNANGNIGIEIVRKLSPYRSEYPDVVLPALLAIRQNSQTPESVRRFVEEKLAGLGVIAGSTWRARSRG